jgi:hypothetical protein
MYYVPHPTETAGLIQTMLLKDSHEPQTYDAPRRAEAMTEEDKIIKNSPNMIGPKEVSYDVK